MLDKGLHIRDISDSIAFTIGIGPFYFMEISKLRAARMVWAQIIEAYGGDSGSRKMSVHGRTSFFNQTTYDPYVNMLRTTTEAFSAIVGGVDSLFTNFFDEPYGTPEEFSRRTARNIQIILKEESHLDQIIDPAGGSYYVEKLTHEVATKAWQRFQEIQGMGGMLKALEKGIPQKEIEEVSKKRSADYASRKSRIVGTNMYANPIEEKLKYRPIDTENIHKLQKENLNNHRASTENKSILQDLLIQLKQTGDSEIIQVGADAFQKGATIGDISSIIKTSSGETPNIQPINQHRASEMFELLRDSADLYKSKTGTKPKVFLVTIGPLAQHKARADFSKGFFEVGGFEVIYSRGFDTTDEAIHSALESQASAVVICSTDETYPALVPEITKKLKEKKPEIIIVLAGYPKDQIEEHKKTGVDEFIYLGANTHQILSNMLKRLGVLEK
jgi:methylmalonyl-CoA mutase